MNETIVVCSSAYYVDNWFYGYQVSCTNPIEYWLNSLGIVIIVIVAFVMLWWVLNLPRGS